MAEAAKSGILKVFDSYLNAIQETLSAGHASEGSHYPTLKTLLESFSDGIIATSLPSRIECGAPDFIVTKGSATLGYIEAKDIGKNLDDIEQGKGMDGERFSHYLDSLTNLILTDYLEFRWYIDGKHQLKAYLGTLIRDGKIRRDTTGIKAVGELLGSFLSHRAEGVGTPKELAQRMARQAHLIRNLIINAFELEPESGNLHTQLVAFQDYLIPDLSINQFADMYAQTIVYGLFAARCTNTIGKDFTRQNAAYLLPKTNPFLRKLFNQIAGPDLDDRIAWLVDDLAQMLAQADMEAILKDFGKHTAKEDPVVHFYETFLKEYDPEIRITRGVYYTPEPVVSYIVRSIDYLLKTRFNKPEGLADEKTLILDPAVGTATFLYMVINEIHQAIIGKGQEGLWNNYLADKLLPRIFGFELLMAPYAVAHLKLGLLLKETGYEFRSNQRLGIYLTNTLEEAIKRAETLFAQWITEEANAAAEIKKEKPIMVVLGNPPYSKSSANKGESIEKLMERYKTAVRSERNIQPLSDDYIKFIRFAHDRIEHTSYGIVGMVTNHSYLSGLIHRGMREELMKTFSEIYVLDLHGNSLIGEKTPEGSTDQNVFDIQQGVAISLFIKKPGGEPPGPTKVFHADLWGLQKDKYSYLLATDIASTNYIEVKPCSPNYFFIPMTLTFADEYRQGWRVCDIFPLNSSGIKTHRDDFVIDFDELALRERISAFRETRLSDEEVRQHFNLREWDIGVAREMLRRDQAWGTRFTLCLYRPFDLRSIFYSANVIERPRSEVMQHMLEENIALVTTRLFQGPEFSGIIATRHLVEMKTAEATRGTYCFPLYLYSTEGEIQFENGHRYPNLNPEFIKYTSEKLGLHFIEDGRGDLGQTFGPEDIFNYAYAVFHSPIYRNRYAEFLKIDFPRLPITSNKKLFEALAVKGMALVSLHLVESPILEQQRTQIKFNVSGSNVVEKVIYNEANRRVYINKKQYFEGITREVWNFNIGGYLVCQKWLKDRKGRTLTYDELTHYQKVIVALKETIRIMAEIDTVIPGWPVE